MFVILKNLLCIVWHFCFQEFDKNTMLAKSNTRWTEGYMEAMALSLQCCTHWFWHTDTYIYCVPGWNWRAPHQGWEPCQKMFLKIIMPNWHKVHLPNCSKFFLQLFFKNICGQHLGAHTNSMVQKHIWV